MLILTRKPGEAIRIAGDVSVHILSVRGSLVRVGIEAPPDVVVWRGEVWDRMTAEEREHGPLPGHRR